MYHDCPYTSPFSALAWYISRKTVLALLKAADFVEKHTRFGKKRTTPPLIGGNALPTNASPFRVRLSRNMTRAAYYVALRSDNGMTARALGWTLDKMDEEGELVQFAAGIPGFSRSTKVKDALSILEEAPKRSTFHQSLWRHIISLLVRSAKPGLLLDSKLLPESVRQERIKICLEALYFLPHAIEKLLAHAATKLNDPKVKVGLAPLLGSVESWLVAERLSKPHRRIHQDVTIAAQCVAAVVSATQMPNEQTELIFMRQLKIENCDTLGRYATNGHSLLLKNLNNFLENTALGCINMDAEKFHIVLSTVRLVTKGLQIKKTQQELRDDYEMLLIRKIGPQAMEPSSVNAKKNAGELLKTLPIPSDLIGTAARGPAANAEAGHSASPPADESGTVVARATPVRTPRTFPPPPLQPILRHSGDVHIPMASPTSHPSSPYETYPLMSMSSSNRFSRGSE